MRRPTARDGRKSLISDHALLRFMERVCQVEIRHFETMMWDAMKRGEKTGDGFIIGENGEHYVLGREGIVVTVLPPDAGRRHRREIAEARRAAA